MRTQIKSLLAFIVAFMFMGGFVTAQIEGPPIDPIPPQEAAPTISAAGNPLAVHFSAPEFKMNVQDLQVNMSVHISQLNIKMGKESFLTPIYDISGTLVSGLGADTLKSGVGAASDTTATLSFDRNYKWGNIDLYDSLSTERDSIAVCAINKAGWVTRIMVKDVSTSTSGAFVNVMCNASGGTKQSYQIPEGLYPYQLFFYRMNTGGGASFVNDSRTFLRYRFFND